MLATAIAVFYGRSIVEQVQFDAAREQLVREASLAAALLEKIGPDSRGVEHLAGILHIPGGRLTLMDSVGNVLADTAPQAQPLKNLDNHADRPEVGEAMRGTVGFATRPSATLNSSMIYAAARVDEGHLLRLAVPLTNLQQDIDSRSAVFMRAGLVAVGLSLLLAVLLSGALRRSLDQMVSVVEGISLGHFRHRMCRIPGSEFAPLAEAVNRMAEKIGESVRALAEQAAQLETILETMEDGVLVLGPRGRIRRCNSALAREFPAAPGATGAQVVELVSSPHLQEAVEDLMRTEQTLPLPPAALAESARGEGPAGMPQAGDEGLKKRRLQLETPSGQVLEACISRPAGQDPGYSGVGAVIVFHDITELVRLERVRRDFVANVSHELRTPLTAIQGYAETLLVLDCPPECRRFSEIILKHALCLSRMVADLLSLSRLENETAELKLVPTDPREAVEQAASMCRESLEQGNCRLELDFPEKCRVMASPPHLAQVFRNLLENALRYTPSGGTVRIVARQCAEGLMFRVLDDGPGIPPEDLGRVFERFYQVERHRGQGTSGLGLAICKHILERHGSRIRAESPAEDGSTAFVFTLSSVREPV